MRLRVARKVLRQAKNGNLWLLTRHTTVRRALDRLDTWCRLWWRHKPPPPPP